MSKLQLIATAAFGLEAVVARELKALGYESRVTRPGRIEFDGEAIDLCRANLWLRSADRVLVLLARFPAEDFDALFERTGSLPWEEWITADAAIPVRGRSRKSRLSSVPACQRTVKKAIVKRLLQASGRTSLPETGPPVPVEVALLNDEAMLSIDTSGEGLHKRGYRRLAGPAQLRETLAAALVQLSFWKPGRPFLDPFCGTGTIVIEAAMLGRNLAPGRNRPFAAEHWPAIPPSAWKLAREEADDLARPTLASGTPAQDRTVQERLLGTDIDCEALKLARYHAEQAGVIDDIHFQQRDFADTLSKRRYGCLITNPPYGLRIGAVEPRSTQVWHNREHERGAVDEINALYQSMPDVFRRLSTWSHYILSARSDLEHLVGQQANRRRKLYNGGVECTYFQFHGPKPGEESGGQGTGGRSQEAGDRGQGAGDRSQEAGDRGQGAGDRGQGAGAGEGAGEGEGTGIRPQASIQAFGGLLAEADRQAAEFAKRLRKRARHLRRWPTKRKITCYRLYDRDIPEVPLAVDCYEDALHIAEYDRPHERTPAQHADWLDHMIRTAAKTLGVLPEDVFVKFRARQRDLAQYERVSDDHAIRVVQEGGLRFRVNLSDYIDTGLFLDHRITRGMIREVAEGKRFLNLFAYTGAFTVYAAAGGAVETTSVDLSANYLDWTCENMRLNGFNPNPNDARHMFHRGDSAAFLDRLDRGHTFDLAVVDPPTYSNSKSLATDWDVQRDHVRLLKQVLNHLTPGGTLYFSTNSRRFKLDELALLSSVSSLHEISRQTVPEDFRNKRIHRCWRMTKR